MGVIEDEYARRTLMELVKHVFSKPTGPIKGLTYKTLAFRIGRRNRNGEGVAVGMGRILGRMGHMLQQLEDDWRRHIPDIQCLAINQTGKNRGLPGDGIKEFWSGYGRLTRKQKQARVGKEHTRIVAFGSEWREVLKRLDKGKSYWVVSPNVRMNEATVGEWRQASVTAHAAFMGYQPTDRGHGQIGPTFAGRTKRGIKSGDIILIARRHRFEPEVVGFGVVHGKFEKRIGVKTPESFGSLRRLRPFIPWSEQAPARVPLIEALRHTKALVRLHPETNDAHRKTCDWIDQKLLKRSSGQKRKATIRGKDMNKRSSFDVGLVSLSKNHQLDYKIQKESSNYKGPKS
jgi:hypothetical protein